MNKVLCYGIMIMGFAMADALAVPTVRKLGNATPTVNVKPAATLPAPDKPEDKTKTTQNIVPRTAVKVMPSGGTSARLPIVNVSPVKTVGSGGVKVINTDSSSGSGVSAEEFRAVKDRVQTLEDKTEDLTNTTVRDVITREDGTYVTDVDKEGDQLHVTKTYLLHAPVRDRGSDDIKGTAEMWIVR